MMRWLSIPLSLSASSIRTPKMAPVDPVMPMMRRRITILALQSREPKRTSPRFRKGYQQMVALATIASGRPALSAESALEQMAEPLLRDPALLGAGRAHLRELVAPVPGAAGVDDRSAVGEVTGRLALGLDARIERRRPGVADDVDRGGRVRAREQGPHQLLEIGDVDVVVDHDHVSPAIGTDMAHGGDMAGLLGMAGIALVDRDREQQPRVADLMRPSRGDARHARLLDVLAQQAGSHHRAIAADLVRRPLRDAAQQDRIVAIIDRLDVEHGLGPQIAGVIAGPFRERALDALVAGLDEDLYDDLGVGRDRQAGDGAVDDLDRLAADAADDLVFADAVGHFAAGHQEGHGIAAADHGDRHALAARLVLVAHLAAMLSGRDVETRGPGVMDHHAIGPAVDPALVGIAGDVEAAGADIAAAVAGVPFRRGKAGDVDVVAGHHVLEDRTVVDVFGRDARHRPHEAGAKTFAELQLAEAGREAERHVLALAAEEVDQHAAARDRPWHIVEDEAGRAVVVHRDAGPHADILLPRQPAHLLDLAEPARLVEPLPQVVIDQVRLRIGGAVGGRADPIADDPIAVGVGLRRHETSWSGTRRHVVACETRCCLQEAIPRASLHTRLQARIPQVCPPAALPSWSRSGRETCFGSAAAGPCRASPR